MRRIFWFWGLLVFFLDQGTKYGVVQKLALGQTFPIVKGFFHFTHVRNAGVAFGFLTGYRWLFLVMTLLILLFIFYLQATLKRDEALPFLILGLIAGGAAGNFVDRWRYGLVIDFLDFRGLWPYVFNLADVAIVGGVFLWAGQILWGDKDGDTGGK